MSNFPLDWTPMREVLVELDGSGAVRRVAATARRAVAELDRAIPLHPEHHALVAGQEARDSSAIEGLFGDRHVLACRRATEVGRAALAELPIGRRLAEAVCSEILEEPVEVRRVQCTIQRSDGAVVYMPPSGHERLLNLLGDWERGMNDEAFDPLVQAAAGHAQFEAIHPFHDGNGRSGRGLVALHLTARGCLSAPLICLSDRLRSQRPAYYRGLSDFRSVRAWETWTCFMLEAIARGADVAQYVLEQGL